MCTSHVPELLGTVVEGVIILCCICSRSVYSCYFLYKGFVLFCFTEDLGASNNNFPPYYEELS